MNNSLQMMIQYKIKACAKREYELVVHSMMKELQKFGVENIKFQKDTLFNDEYWEFFKIPTVSHFHALKKIRMSKKHPIFGRLHELLDDEQGAIQCYAIRTMY
ncbi:hypothetical protein J2S13_002399 [Oikeobacillus pervagus]|uniref:Uncharacterized protein n=1 Tax=Oikeobacillus pervagus TaxID=1325931 RepID=A0AAJ1T392_9BACI|nr:hypothetical protein [Oikeobacillus pervagus]MDQ0215977.1 hypothetical protein [Oikeobacillus pervagus]